VTGCVQVVITTILRPEIPATGTLSSYTFCGFCQYEDVHEVETWVPL
jgi:hypothetical protein